MRMKIFYTDLAFCDTLFQMFIFTLSVSFSCRRRNSHEDLWSHGDEYLTPKRTHFFPVDNAPTCIKLWDSLCCFGSLRKTCYFHLFVCVWFKETVFIETDRGLSRCCTTGLHFPLNNPSYLVFEVELLKLFELFFPDVSSLELALVVSEKLEWEQKLR